MPMSKVYVRNQIRGYPQAWSLNDKPPATRALLEHIKVTGSLQFGSFDRKCRPLWRPYQVDFGSMDIHGNVEMIGGMYAKLLSQMEKPGTLVMAPDMDRSIPGHMEGSGLSLPCAQLRELPGDSYDVMLPGGSKRPVILLLYAIHSGYDAIGMVEALYDQYGREALPTDILALFDGRERPDHRLLSVRTRRWVKPDIRIHSIATVEDLYAICTSERQEFNIRHFLDQDCVLLDRRFRTEDQFDEFLLYRVDQRLAISK